MRLWSKWKKGGALLADVLKRNGIDPTAAAAQEVFSKILNEAEAAADTRLKNEQADGSLSPDERNTRWEALFFEEIRARAKSYAQSARNQRKD
ncbi:MULTISPECIES: hypothetical protein [unclassified Thioalkalivibrio]|uniref:hypothetical protein n=1 Tax=unclassified Thioalkalivibrio TaxID=2621013 RepID=UPI00036E6BC7|nr:MULTISPECIES: hypothetical protein [unclassified Thioalkalivibrio]